MNALALLRKGHSKAICQQVVTYVGDDPRRFQELVDAFYGGPYRITQRAAWPLSYCVEAHPVLVKPHLRKLVQNLRKPDLPVAVKRNTLRLLQFIDLPASLQGLVADVSFRLLQDPKETIAVHVFAMTVLARIARVEPEIGQELRVIIEDKMPYAGPAFRSRGSKALQQLGLK